MDEFNKWYETFEGNGEELLCYNVYDLLAAFNAGKALAHNKSGVCV